LEDSLRQIERFAAHPRFIGLKTIQNNYDRGLDDPLYEPLLREAARLDLPVLAHLTGMEGAASRNPQVRFIAAHGNWGRTQRLHKLPNVWFDLSTSHAREDETQLERFIRAVGVQRVLFGSDGQLVAPVWSLSKLLDCRLSEDELDQILRRNAYTVFTKLRPPS
jgi:predicted TIM-barrel fold metal-dependent hydrolase